MWFIARGKERVGPYSLEQLRTLAGRRELTPQDMVLQQGQARWQQAKDVPGLYATVSAPLVQPIAKSASSPPTKPGNATLAFFLFPVFLLGYLLQRKKREKLRRETESLSLSFGQSLYQAGLGDAYARNEIAQSEALILDSQANPRDVADSQARRTRYFLKLADEQLQRPISGPLEAERQRLAHAHGKLRQVESDTASSRERAWPSSPSGKIAAMGNVALLLILAVGFGAWLVWPNSSAPPEESVAQEQDKLPYSPLDVVSSASDERDIAGAVGFVVCGLGVTLPDSQITDVPMSSGTCFSISKSGHLLTNKHVIEKVWDLQTKPEAQRVKERFELEKGLQLSPEIWVFFRSKMYPAKIEYVSDDFDLAVLKINRQHRPFFALSKEEKFPRGQDVSACGFPAAARIALSEEEVNQRVESLDGFLRRVNDYFRPRDFEYVLTTGKISRTVTEESERRWIQHNAAISQGNSGGPLLLDDGTVVGINTMIARPDAGQGIFYSLSVEQMRFEINKVVRKAIWR